MSKASSPYGTFYGVGIGPGDPELLTLKAVRILQRCDVIFTVCSANVEDSTSENVVLSLQPKGRIIRLNFSMSKDKTIRENIVAQNTACILAELEQGHDCAFATLGDSLSYSTCGYVLERLKTFIPDLRSEIVPGITSWNTLAACAQTVLCENKQELRIIPSFSKDMVDNLHFPKNSATILLKTYHSRNALLERLRHEDNISVVYGENLCRDEQFLSSDLNAIAAREDKYLSLMLVKKS